MINIAIFASGSGSNALKIMDHFQGHHSAKISLVVCNKKEAGVLQHARQYGIPSVLITRQSFYEQENIRADLSNFQVDFIVLAGFLWLIPPYLVQAYPKRIVNIHPSLLPKFGGKGMFGMHVHEAVKATGEKQTGMTIHYVNEKYDDGDTILQAFCAVKPTDDAQQIAQNVLKLEHFYFPKTIEFLILNLIPK